MGAAAMASTREEQLAAVYGSTLTCPTRCNGVEYRGRGAGADGTLDAAANTFLGLRVWGMGMDGTLDAAAMRCMRHWR